MGSARTITTKLNAQHALQLALYGMRNDKAPTKRRQLMLHINLLGAPEIYLDDQLQLRFRTRKAQALLIYLATTERSWSRDALATLFWPETSDATALKNLRDILPSLRRQLGDYLLLDNEMIGLNPASGCKCDVIEFQTLLEGQLQQLNTEQLAATLRLYRGEFLEGYSGARISADFELWAVRERERFHQLALMGFTTFCRRKQERGDYEAALGANRQILKLAPWDEAAHRQQMLLLAQSGQQAAALAHFETCCQILADELDIKPMPETTALYQQIRLGEYGKDSATKVQSAALETSRTDAHPQFGRRNHALPTIPHNLPTSLLKHIGYADELDYVQRQLFNAECRLLTIVGTGGVGKTHLALEAARHIVQAPDAEARFGDGVYFVPLDGVHASPSPELVEAAIASAIGKALDYTLSGSVSPQLQLQKRLEGKKVLLVLDNMEHLLTGALLMTALLQRAAYLSILVTSREKLNLRGEHLLKLTGLLPLPLPTPAISDPNAMGDSANSAAALFVYHAQLVTSGASLRKP